MSAMKRVAVRVHLPILISYLSLRNAQMIELTEPQYPAPRSQGTRLNHDARSEESGR